MVMEKFGRAQPVRRLEDARFLTGQGRYVDDIAPEGALHAVVVRSSVAHADLRGVDVEAAREAPGVACVLTFADLREAGIDDTMSYVTVKNRDGSKAAAPERPLLARDRVRYVGEAVALVVAETPGQARDAAELVELDLVERPAHMALAPGGEPIHDEAPDNLAFDWAIGDEEATARAFEGAAHVVRLDVADNRVIANAMEPRGAWAEWTEDGRLHLCVNGQGVWDQKSEVARHLGVDAERVRVTNPDVGGGFGMKGAPYPEYTLIAQAARVAGRPVRWMAERTESMLSDHAGRDLVSTAEAAFDVDHRLIGYRVDTLSNLGAHCSQFSQLIQGMLFSKVFTGTYDVKAAYMRARGVFTNTTQVDAYRGAGRPEAIYVLERTMDQAARELGVDPWELRRRNFIGHFPYETASGETYDVGDFSRVMDRVAREADVEGFPARREKARAEGKLLGLGICYYIESILGDPSEGAKVVFEEDGGVALYVGTQSNGQGHETVYAQFLADHTGMPVDAIRIVQGDSDLIAQGGGTGGSRSVTTQGTATLATVGAVIEAFSGFLAEEEGVDAAQVSFDDERFRVKGSNTAPTMLEVAEMARAAGRAELLTQECRASLPGRSYPNGCHVAEIEIDPDTGRVAVTRYTVTDDFGNLVNPLLAEGQVHGGVAQGIGQALSEHTVFDEDGQLLTATFMDYGMPRAVDVPYVAFHSEPVPSTANVLGMKGCGEAGTVGALAAVANAVTDAVAPLGIGPVQMPFTPVRMWEAMRATPMAAE
jgi:carbon-monoxide dehydrogenase large subunit